MPTPSKHQENVHVQDGRMQVSNSQELDQSSDDVKVTEWFGESPSTVPIQMGARSLSDLFQTVESESKKNDLRSGEVKHFRLG